MAKLRVITALATAAAAVGWGVTSESVDPLAGLSEGDLAEGRRLYDRHCAACHAPDGGGGRGASLKLPRLRYAADGQSLIRVIQNGLPGTEMPATWQMSSREIRRVAAYVRTLGQSGEEALPGDWARGRELYVSTGCAQCHIVKGEGSGLGPELTEIGAKRNSAYLREALLEPAKAAPERFLMVRAHTAGGRTVHGARLSEDPFTIQIRDSGNWFHSLKKSELIRLDRLSGETWMPSYAHLPPKDLEDLVAYLAGLRGER